MKQIGNGFYSDLFKGFGIKTFREALTYIQNLPYGRNSQRDSFELVLIEKKGSCSSKHALLAELAIENQWKDVELICGIFLMSPTTHPILTSHFQNKPYDAIPEAHCYLKINGERLDLTSKQSSIKNIETKIVREQRIEPHQVVEWKVLTHKDYIRKYLLRNPHITLSFDEFWDEREKCITLFDQM